MVCEFDVMGVLFIKYNDILEKVFCIYDVYCDGFVIVGGGGMVVVEELEYVLVCGVYIYVEIVGYGVIFDGVDMVVLFGEGVVCCMKMVMYGVDILIDYLNFYGILILVGDVKELAVICEVFGDKSLVIFVIKVMIGYFLGAVGVQEVIYFLLMLEYGFIVLSINIEELDEQAVGLNIVIEMIDCELIIVMFNSFGFGGINVMLVMCKLKD